jgi:hypothetical protein
MKIIQHLLDDMSKNIDKFDHHGTPSSQRGDAGE